MATAAALIPEHATLERLREAAADCRACPLPALGTIHPSAILRAPDEAARREERRLLAADLEVVAQALA